MDVILQLLQYFQQMQPTSLQSLAAKHIATLTTIHNNAIAKSQRITHQVYNRQSRNISKFIKEQREFQMKAKQQEGERKSRPVVKKTRFGVTLRYEENESMELEYEQNKIMDLRRLEAEKKQKQLMMDNTVSSGFKRSTKKGFMKGHASLRFNLVPPKALDIKINKDDKARSVSRKHTKGQTSPTSPNRRVTYGQGRRLNTQYQQSPTPRNESPIPKRNQTFSNNRPIIDMNRQKMERFIRTLHRVAWMAKYLRGKCKQVDKSEQFKEHMRRFSLDRDSSIESADLNYMIARRYNLLSYHLDDLYDKKMKELQAHVSSVERQKLVGAEEYSLLDSLSKHSILSILSRKKKVNELAHPSPIQHATIEQRSEQEKHQNTVRFSLPYAQFISERETKISIYRMASMNPMVYLRIAFSLYDKNNNGKVDQDDLLQAISLSRKMPQLEPDILLMSSVMLAQRKSSRKVKKQERELTQPIRVTVNKEDSILATNVRSECSEEEPEQEKEGKAAVGFSPEKFYIFMQEKQTLKKKEVSPIPPEELVMPLTFTAFCKAFRNKKPAILYDVLRFILGAHNEDFLDYNQPEPGMGSNLKKRSVLTEPALEESLEEKWNSRLKETNNMLYKLVTTKQY